MLLLMCKILRLSSEEIFQKSGLTCKETLNASVFQLSKSNPFYWIFIDFNLSEITMPYFLGIRMG